MTRQETGCVLYNKTKFFCARVVWWSHFTLEVLRHQFPILFTVEASLRSGLNCPPSLRSELELDLLSPASRDIDLQFFLCLLSDFLHLV